MMASIDLFANWGARQDIFVRAVERKLKIHESFIHSKRKMERWVEWI